MYSFAVRSFRAASWRVRTAASASRTPRLLCWTMVISAPAATSARSSGSWALRSRSSSGSISAERLSLSERYAFPAASASARAVDAFARAISRAESAVVAASRTPSRTASASTSARSSSPNSCSNRSSLPGQDPLDHLLLAAQIADPLLLEVLQDLAGAARSRGARHRDPRKFVRRVPCTQCRPPRVPWLRPGSPLPPHRVRDRGLCPLALHAPLPFPLRASSAACAACSWRRRSNCQSSTLDSHCA